MATAPSRPANRMKARTHRPSMNLHQPQHRLPVWARSERAYHRYIEDPPHRPVNRVDYGMDNFSYSPTYLHESKVAWALIPRLPETLRENAKLFILSLAAIHTALERIDNLEQDASNRADPATTHRHLIARRVSDYAPAVVGAETPPSATISTPAIPASKKSLTSMAPQLPVNMLGMESPPITPVDSKVANTPIYDSVLGPNGMVLDLEHANAKLRCKPILSSPSSDMPIRNEIAWQSYVRQFNAEIADLKSENLRRLLGYESVIDREMYDCLLNGALGVDAKMALQEFRAWWMDIKARVVEIKEKVKAYEEKPLGSKEEMEDREESRALGRWV